MEGLKDRRIEGRKEANMEGWKDGRTGEWRDGRKERCKDGKQAGLVTHSQSLTCMLTAKIIGANFALDKFFYGYEEVNKTTQ